MLLRIAERTIRVLSEIVTGNEPAFPAVPQTGYRTGRQIIDFFNELGIDDEEGLWARGSHAQRLIRGVNGTARMKDVIQFTFEPDVFQVLTASRADTAAAFDLVLRRDGFELIETDGHYRVRDLSGELVRTEQPPAAGQINDEFIREQLEKCDAKLQSGDFDGAITNARSLVEELLRGIERTMDPTLPAYDGDLVGLWRRVHRALRLDPAIPEFTDSERQTLGGLHSVINGLAGQSNEMGDRHAPEIRAQRRDARLAVNAARTFVDFVYDVFVVEYVPPYRTDA